MTAGSVTSACFATRVMLLGVVLDRDLGLRIRGVGTGDEEIAVPDLVLDDWLRKSAPTKRLPEQRLRIALGRPLPGCAHRQQTPECWTTRATRPAEPSLEDRDLSGREQPATKPVLERQLDHPEAVLLDRAQVEERSRRRRHRDSVDDGDVDGRKSLRLVHCDEVLARSTPSWAGDLDDLATAGQPVELSGAPVGRHSSEASCPTRSKDVTSPCHGRPAHPIDVVVDGDPTAVLHSRLDLALGQAGHPRVLTAKDAMVPRRVRCQNLVCIHAVAKSSNDLGHQRFGVI